MQNIDECTDHTLHIKAIDTAVEGLEKLSTIEAAFEQIKWERDTAIKQLESYGVKFYSEEDVAMVDCGMRVIIRTFTRHIHDKPKLVGGDAV